jgi:hypothetical protein
MIQNNTVILSSEANLSSQYYLVLLKRILAGLLPLRHRILIDSGYAVEALLGGNITRVHNDLDLILITSSIDISVFESLLIKLISTETYVEWISRPTKSNWLWLQGKNAITGEQYQINIHILSGNCAYKNSKKINVRSSAGKPYSIETINCYIYTPSGDNIKISSPILEYMVATKIWLIESYGNNPRLKDIHDLKRMIECSYFSAAKCLDIIIKRYESNQNLTSQQAKEKAIYNFNEAMNFLPHNHAEN